MALPDLSSPKEMVQKFMAKLSPPWMGTVVLWPQILAGDAALAEWRAERPFPPAPEAPTPCPQAQ